IDIISFNQALEEQRSRARAHSLGLGSGTTEKIWFSLKEKYGATQFIGYDLLRGSKFMKEDRKVLCQKPPIDLTNGVSSLVTAIVQQGEIVEEAVSGQ
ncbi:alanine--tRNA ligase, partial [Candidatus Liberibacter asiaticus]